ncbi:MAG: tetratricopeptide repeat protein [Geminicoccaceae bacterium]
MAEDRRGLEHTSTSDEAVGLFDQAVDHFLEYRLDTADLLKQAKEADPAFVMPHILKAAMLRLMGSNSVEAPIAAEVAALDALDVARNPREALHEKALRHWLRGDLAAASRAWEAIVVEWPFDLLALRHLHFQSFWLGEQQAMRNVVAGALPAWSPELPGYGFVQGMLAFGLEETGDYAAAERAGRRGVELEPRDGWAQHAVAHVMEMQCRQEDGIAWMTATPDAWSRDSFFAVHNWWHLALYHLELGDTDAALALFDGPIYGARSGMALDMVDASALLWRLHLRGVEPGERWQALADRWAALRPGFYAFNDVHAVMAAVGAGRPAMAAGIVEALEAASLRRGDNALFSAEVGLRLARAIVAFGRGEHRKAAALIRPVRGIAHRFGGSHAQRDVIDLTLIEAALRSGEEALARGLIAERAARRHESPLTRLFMARSRVAALAA